MPISLLNSVAKAFEELVFKYLYNHLQGINMISSLQSGFIPVDSTVNQRACLYHIFTKALMLVKRYVLSSVTSAKLLIVYGMKDLFTNLKLLVFQKTPADGFKTTFQDAVSV